MGIHDGAKLLFGIAILCAVVAVWTPARPIAIPFGLLANGVGGLLALGGS